MRSVDMSTNAFLGGHSGARVVPPEEVLARQIHFVRKTPADVTPLIQGTEPEPWVAVMETISPEHAMDRNGGILAEESMLMLWLPGGCADALEWQQRTEAWMARPLEQLESPPTIELLLRGTRILWRPGRAVIHGGTDRLDELLPALASFAFYERVLRALEQDIHTDLLTAGADVPLTHGLTQAALQHQAHVNTMTQRVTQHRLRYVRVVPQFNEPSSVFSRSAGQMMHELTAHTKVHQRLQTIDDQLEVLEDLYELANDRLSEFRYFRSEYVLELWIIAVLALEVGLLLWELCLFYLPHAAG